MRPGKWRWKKVEWVIDRAWDVCDNRTLAGRHAALPQLLGHRGLVCMRARKTVPGYISRVSAAKGGGARDGSHRHGDTWA